MLKDPAEFEHEVVRIRHEYARRRRDIPSDYYALHRPAVFFAHQQRTRQVRLALERHGYLPLRDRRILDLGCGEGDWLADLEAWGAKRENLAGLEIDAVRLARARARFAPNRGPDDRPGDGDADLRAGNGWTLPWEDATFDLVILSTVFTSILSTALRAALAAEVVRVLRHGGAVVWYDFFMNNPRNRQVRGIGAREIRRLFPGFDVALSRVTLAPPLARCVVPLSRTFAALLEAAKLLNTHHVGVIRRPAAPSPSGHA